MNDEKRAGLVKPPLRGRMDRSETNITWYRTIRNDLKGISNMHSFQDAQSLFGRWNLFEEIFSILFDKKMNLLLDKYCLEYTQLLNITLDKTFKYTP